MKKLGKPTITFKKELCLSQIEETNSAFAALKIAKSKTAHKCNDYSVNIKKKLEQFFFCHTKGHLKSQCRFRQPRKKNRTNSKDQVLCAETKTIQAEFAEDM